LAESVIGPTDIAELLALIVYGYETVCVFSIIGTPTDIAVFAVVFPTIVAGIFVSAIYLFVRW
jgi:hypothetical protein